ncbi:hypothetical protein CK203_003994 [Vitis vinifera]|uniref:Sacsin n=1 Tax=Vitis vinifera TaxID=29760 RepID=A0A438K9G8_VITVI|nr:hypothetical protein CK203_003994 [Vitis vinifera]
MATPEEHIKEIRRTKFSIGGELNPLTEDLHQAVKNLSAELYAKDVHFLMELIQNAEDNDYPEGVNPSLELVITSQDITGTGASATLLIFNNEKGFQLKILSLSAVLGGPPRKTIGSVAILERKYGEEVDFRGIGFKSVFLITAQPYIFSNGYQIRFNEEPCPHSNLGYIVPEWVQWNPTLDDIKQIYGSHAVLPTTTIILPLKPDKIGPVKEQLSSIQPEVLLFLSKIKQFSVKKHNEDPRLNTVNAISISSEINFVKRKNIDADSYILHLSTDGAKDVTEKECSYYMWRQKFPVRQENQVERRLGVEELGNNPLDNKWNQGILDCVPSAFLNAFISLVTTSQDVPVSTLTPMFKFLPIYSSPYPKLNDVRELIKAELLKKNIVPCESYSDQKIFRKPCEVGRLMPSFWNILKKARKQGVSLHSLSSHGKYILNSSFDTEEYDHILNFLGVEPVNSEWYAKCIKSSNLVLGVTEDGYLELLLFIAEKWSSSFYSTDMKNVPLLKYVGPDGNVVLCATSNVTMWNGESTICMSRESQHISWLIDWNREFRRVTDRYFVPKSTQEAIRSFFKRETLLEWLQNQVKVRAVSVKDFAVILYNYGHVSTQRKGVLVPANGSKWVGLMGTNPWRGAGYVELGEDYLRSGTSDIPHISPPDAELSAAYAPLTKQNAFLLLDWIHNLKYKQGLPAKFLTSIKKGSWFKISLSGSPGYRPPSESFLLASSDENLLQDESVMVDIPLIDQGFYGNGINCYKEELKTVGVMFEYGEACEFIGRHLMSLAASSALTKSSVFEILKFIRFLRLRFLPADKFIQSIINGRWLKTSCGHRSPVGSVLFDQEWKAASQISDIPFIDQDHYGKEILRFKMELQLLGVVVGFNKNYQLVTDHLKSQACSNHPTAEAILLIFECMRDCERNSRSAHKLIQALKGNKCLKTNMGYNILSYEKESRQAGNSGGFEAATQKFLAVFKKHASSSSIGREHVLSFLRSYRQIDKTNKFPSDFKRDICQAKWLQTRLGVPRSPRECILFGPEWEPVSSITVLPFIDDSDKYYGKRIHEYSKELRSLGVTIKYKDGVRFVAAGVYFPQDPSTITPESVFSLLQCIQILMKDGYTLTDAFRKKVSQSWLKTNAGYRSPGQSLLFGSEWGSFLHRNDGPFIDEEFYGPNITAYKNELEEIGVTIDVLNGCSLLAGYLDFHSEFSTIVRVYNYLNKHGWSPCNDTPRRIWIPNGSDSGEWVSPEKCVIHDKDGLFSSRLNVLEKHYKPELFSLFCRVMQVKSNPSIDDYCELWNNWENSREQLSRSECCAFWAHVSKHWNDLQLKYLFQQSSPHSIFVWYPQPSIPSLPRTKLLDIYREIGVRSISKSVQKEEISKLEASELKQVSQKETLIGKGLLKLILGFLAGPSIEMEAGQRLDAVKGLLNLKTNDALGPEDSNLFMQKMEISGGHKNKIEYGTIFAEVISEGVLQEKEDHIPDLAELIMLAFLLDFDEEAVGF